jgi:hypothetical protein
VDDLHVDSHLTTMVADDEDTDAATARLERLLQTGPQVALVNDRQVLLDVTSLGHGDNGAVLHVKDTVLLEDGAEHGLDDDAGCRVGDERRLLVQLLGEEVDTKVAVLAGSRRGGDADDLAGAALQDEDVTQADVVAWDGDGVGGVRVLRGRSVRAGTAGLNALGHLGALSAVFVVVAHLGFLGVGSSGVGFGVSGSVDGLLGDLDVLLVDGTCGRGVDGRLAYAVGFLVNGAVAGSVDGGLVDTDAFLEDGAMGRGINGGLVDTGVRLVNGTVAGRVDGGTDDAGFFTVVGLEAGTVFVLSNVNGSVLATTGLVDIDVDVRLRVRSARSAVLLAVVLSTDAGTAVSFLFTSNADLFFSEALLSGRRKISLGLERRVLTFPSGSLREFDL